MTLQYLASAMTIAAAIYTVGRAMLPGPDAKGRRVHPEGLFFLALAVVFFFYPWT